MTTIGRTALQALALLAASGAAAGPPAVAKRTAVAQLQPIPEGLTLPVRLSHGLKAGSSRLGTPVICYTTQPVPISGTHFLPTGVELTGTVTASDTGDRSATHPASLTIHFTALRWHGVTLPVTVQALAVANFSAAEDTYDPVSGGGDRENNTPANWTTLQVGGDVLTRFNWEGELDNKRSQKVGYADFHGVYADPLPGSTGVAAIPHAVGIFSTTAHGLYGFSPDDRLETLPGGMTLTSPHTALLRTGDQLLLEVAAGSSVVAAQP